MLVCVCVFSLAYISVLFFCLKCTLASYQILKALCYSVISEVEGLKIYSLRRQTFELTSSETETAADATEIRTSFPGLERREDLLPSHVQILFQLRPVRRRGQAP